ncbi:MAG: molecular chaperone DnaJ, partial [candidate division Zixibacteria bacterium]|nr:molecular chaperone DnaJ [candidate division Zixibacteria bacterium]
NRGEDLRARLELTLEEITLGVKRTLRVKRFVACVDCSGSGAKAGTRPERCSNCNGVGRVRKVTRTIIGAIQQVTTCPVCGGAGDIITAPCETCKGSGRYLEKTDVEVDVPAGVSEGNYVTIQGMGNVGQQGGAFGDLQVVFEEKEHERFIRRGDDIILPLIVSFPTAALGAKLEVPTVRGVATIKIHSGTQSGKAIRLKGEGIPHLRSFGRGDQIVVINVWTPNKLNAEDKRLLETMKSGGSFDPPEAGKSFFSKLRDTLGV